MDESASNPDEPDRSKRPPSEVVARVRSAFFIYSSDKLLEPLDRFLASEHSWTHLLRDAADGLRGATSAASLPFELIHDAVNQRRFDRILGAERIRLLPLPSEQEVENADELALSRAQESMRRFLDSLEGRNFVRDSIVYELDRSLRTPTICSAAAELLIQTLVSTWTIFESFARSFSIAWINGDPRRAEPVLASPDLKEYFGKQVVDIKVIGDHDFNLSKSMGNILFREKRLDSLPVIRSVMEALFNDVHIRAALGDDVWMLNQRRHLFVHKRGLVDREYLERTGDSAPAGKRLHITSHDVERYLESVQRAVIAIATAAEARASVAGQGI